MDGAELECHFINYQEHQYIVQKIVNEIIRCYFSTVKQSDHIIYKENIILCRCVCAHFLILCIYFCVTTADA